MPADQTIDREPGALSSSSTSTGQGSQQTGQKWPSWELSPPPEGHPDVGRWVWNKFELMKKYRDKLGLPSMWLHFHELYRNRMFRKQQAKGTLVPVNLFFKSINTLKANLTDSKPRASITSVGETDPETAKAWQHRYDTWWDSTKQQHCLQESVGKSELYGFTVDKMWYDPNQEAGLGEVSCQRCDPFGVFLWPRCIAIQDQPMMAVATAMDLGKIYQQWPDSTDKVRPDPKFSDLLGEDRVTVRANKARETRPIGAPAGYVAVEHAEKPYDFGDHDLQRALVVEMWCKDYTMEWLDPQTGQSYPYEERPELYEPAVDTELGSPVFTEDGGQVHVPREPVLQSKYPGFIRQIIVTNSGNLVLSDLPNPSINPEIPRETACNCYLWDKFPFLKRFSYSDDMSEYGLSVIEQIEVLVIELSKKITHISMHLDASCKPPLLLPKNCGVARKDVTTNPGRIWEPNAALAQFIRWVQVPPLPADYTAFVQLMMRLIEIVTGVSDVSEGRKPTGVTAGYAIATLQEKAQVIYREKIRNGDIYLEEQGRMFISLGQNWYTESRKLIYEGATGKQTAMFRGTDEQYQGEYAFAISAGSTLPKDRNAQLNMYLQLSQAGQVDQKALFDALEVPNGDQIIERMQQGPVNQMLDKVRATGMFGDATDATVEALRQIVLAQPADLEKLFPQMKPENQLAMALMQAGLARGLAGMMQQQEWQQGQQGQTPQTPNNGGATYEQPNS